MNIGKWSDISKVSDPESKLNGLETKVLSIKVCDSLVILVGLLMVGKCNKKTMLS